MKWRGGFTYDGQLVVECETCNGTGLYPVMHDGTVIDRDHCHACGGTADDYWDPCPLLQSLFTAAALAHAFNRGFYRGVEVCCPAVPGWRPNTEGRAA